jgi:hypothetical protein
MVVAEKNNGLPGQANPEVRDGIWENDAITCEVHCAKMHPEIVQASIVRM